MGSSSKNFTSEEIINLIIEEENKAKKVPRSRERKQTELHPSQNISKKNKVQRFYEKRYKVNFITRSKYLSSETSR